MDYIKLDKPITEYTREQLVSLFGMRDENDRGRQVRLMRSIIMNEKEFLNQRYYRSLRHFWYNPVKSILGTLGYLEKQNEKDKPGRRLSQKLSEAICEMVKAGRISYADLAISDDSRKLNTPERRYVVGGQGYQYLCCTDNYRYCLLAVEKDTAYQAIASIAQLVGCSAISGKGQDALAAMERIFRLWKNEDKWPGPYGEIHLLTFTDYDPSGYNIHDTFIDHVEHMKDRFCPGKKLISNRVGLVPEQLDHGKIEFAKYPVSRDKKAIYDKWMDDTGGIDGEPFGLELDTLTVQEIRSLMVTGIEDVIDEDQVLSFDFRRARVKQAILSYLEPKIDSLTGDIYNDVVDSIEKIEGALFDKARKGDVHTLPSEVFKIDEDLVHSLVDDHFGNNVK